MNSSRKGAKGELLVCNYLIDQGYEVFRNVVPSGPADLVAWDPETNETILIDVKCSQRTVRQDGTVTYNCQDKRHKDSPVQILLVYDDEVIGFLDDQDIRTDRRRRKGRPWEPRP